MPNSMKNVTFFCNLLVNNDLNKSKRNANAKKIANDDEIDTNYEGLLDIMDLSKNSKLTI